MTTSIHTIKQQFNRVISHSQEFSKVDSTALFDKWYEAKKSFIDAPCRRSAPKDKTGKTPNTNVGNA